MATMTMATVGQRLRQRREQVGLSQRELGAATGLSYAYISRLEADERSASGKAALLLADPLKTTATWLLYGVDDYCPFCLSTVTRE